MTEAEKVTLCSGQKVKLYEGGNRNDIQELYTWSRDGFIKPVNGNWIYYKEFLQYDNMIYNFQYKPTDVFISGYPKSGTTWIQEVVWTILHNADLNHPLQNENALNRNPWFEEDSAKNVINVEWHSKIIPRMFNIPYKSTLIEMYAALPNRRVFKTHMYTSTINKEMLETSKIVYVIRNPLDSFKSYYMFHRYLTTIGFNKGMSEFADSYIKEQVVCGNAAEHIKDWWPLRGHKNLYIIFYEKLKTDPAGEIRKLSKFLEKELTEEQIQNVTEQTSFIKMKEIFEKTEGKMQKMLKLQISKEQSNFCRKGIIGDSKNMPKEAYDKLSAYFKESLKDITLPYTFHPLEEEKSSN